MDTICIRTDGEAQHKAFILTTATALNLQTKECGDEAETICVSTGDWNPPHAETSNPYEALYVSYAEGHDLEYEVRRNADPADCC